MIALKYQDSTTENSLNTLGDTIFWGVGRKQLSKKIGVWWFTKFVFHVFDRYEIHIQAFVHFINGKLIIFNPRLHKNILRICIQNVTQHKNDP